MRGTISRVEKISTVEKGSAVFIEFYLEVGEN
jgi:hypothetical protein